MSELSILIIKSILLSLTIRQIIKVILAFWTDLTTDVPFHQTSRKVIKQITSILNSNFSSQKHLNFYELGAGDGRLSLALATNTSFKFTAVELNPFLVALGKLKTKLKNLSSRIEWVRQDLFKVDLTDADVVYLYLLEEVNRKLKPKLEAELVVGSKIISWKFNLISDRFKLVEEWGNKDKLRVFEKVKA